MSFGLKFGMGLSGSASGEAGPPVVVNQTVFSGRLTLALGDLLTATNGAITNTGGPITGITLGTNTVGTGAHWSVSGVGVGNDSVPSDVQYVWTGCTATGPGGTSAPFTLTINTEADIYSFHNLAAFDAITALGVAPVDGKTLKGRGGTIPTSTGLTIGNKAYTAQTTVTSHSNTNRCRFLTAQAGQHSVEFRGPTNVRFFQFDIYGEWIDGDTTGTTNNILKLKDSISGLRFEDCVISSNRVNLPLLNNPEFFRGLIGSDGTTDVTGPLEIVNCTITSGNRLLNLGPTSGSGSILVDGCTFTDWGTDCIVYSNASNLTVRYSKFYSPYAHVTFGDHGDFVQGLSKGGDTTGFECHDNVMYAGRFDGLADVKTEFQGPFAEDVEEFPVPTGNLYRDGKIYNNLIVTDISHGVSQYNPEGYVIVGNAAVQNKDWTEAGPRVRILQHHTPNTDDGGNLLAANVSEGQSTYLPAEDTLLTNHVSNNATTGQAESYDQLFDGDGSGFLTSDFSDIDDVIAAYANKAAGALDTANIKGGIAYADFTGATSVEHPFLSTPTAFTFTDVTGAAVDATDQTSSKEQILGIEANGAAIWLTGGINPELKIYDTNGTTVIQDWTDGTVPYLVLNNYHVEVRGDASSSNSATETIVVNIGQVSDNFDITTVAAGVTATSTYTDEDIDSSDLDTYRFSSKSIGTADADRWVFVGVTSRDNALALDADYVTIGLTTTSSDDFTTDTTGSYTGDNATISYDDPNDQLDGTQTASFGGVISPEITVVDGKKYLITVNATNGADTEQMDVWAGTTSGASDLGSVDASGRLSAGATGDMVFTVTASGTSLYVETAVRGGGTETFSINSIVIEEHIGEASLIGTAVKSDDSPNSTYVGMFAANVSAGTTADIVVGFNQQAVRCSIAVYDCRISDTTPFDTATYSNTNGAVNDDIDLSANIPSVDSFAIGVGVCLGTGTITATGLTTDGTQQSDGSFWEMRQASANLSSAETPRTMSFSNATNNERHGVLVVMD